MKHRFSNAKTRRRKDLERLLLESLNGGASKRMTAARRKEIYKKAQQI
jgi:hypothetical protein